jgi:hypothetical protein
MAQETIARDVPMDIMQLVVTVVLLTIVAIVLGRLDAGSLHHLAQRARLECRMVVQMIARHVPLAPTAVQVVHRVHHVRALHVVAVLFHAQCVTLEWDQMQLLIIVFLALMERMAMAQVQRAHLVLDLFVVAGKQSVAQIALLGGNQVALVLTSVWLAWMEITVREVPHHAHSALARHVVDVMRAVALHAKWVRSN